MWLHCSLLPSEPQWNTAGHTAGVFAWHVGLLKKDRKEKSHLKGKSHLIDIHIEEIKGGEFNGQPPSLSHFSLVTFHAMGSWLPCAPFCLEEAASVACSEGPWQTPAVITCLGPHIHGLHLSTLDSAWLRVSLGSLLSSGDSPSNCSFFQLVPFWPQALLLVTPFLSLL